MKVRIMSYNIQSCHEFYSRRVQVDHIVKVIKDLNADIVGLNEVRGKGTADDYQPQAELIARELGMYYYFAKAIDFKGGPYGNALISKYPLSGCGTFLIDDAPRDSGDKYFETRCVLKAHADVGMGVDLLVTHFGLNLSEQRLAVKKVVELSSGLTGQAVLMGDFNCEPSDEVLGPIYERFDDTAPKGTKVPTFSSDNPRIKIDYMFTKGPIKTLKAWAENVIASDHLPYIADLEIE